MQTLITGSPGAGKTLYAIAKLIRPMLGQSVKVTLDDGTVKEYPRKVYTNIKGLLLEHDLVEAGPIWEGNEKAGWKQGEGHRQGWHNWHEWAPPGAILVVDEFQRIWPVRPNGAPVPPDVSAMDTHRHMGVDFILITQKFSFDRHIEGLIGRHLHVRRVANMHAALVYEWDHCSRSLLYRNSMAKTPWRFDKSVFKLYHSADAHTSQPRKVPPLLWVVLAAVAIGAWKIPESVARIAGKQEQHQQRMALHTGKLKQADGKGASQAVQGAKAAGPAVAPSLGSDAPSVVPSAPSRTLAGCVTARNVCRCFDHDGAVMEAETKACQGRDGPMLEVEAKGGGVVAGASAAQDADVLAFMSGRKPIRPLVGWK